MLTFDYTHSLAPHTALEPEVFAEAFDRVLDGLPRLESLRVAPQGSFLASLDADVGEITELAEALAPQIDTLVVIGIGGSSLGAKAVFESQVRPRSRAWRSGPGKPRVELVFVENVDPVEVHDVLESVEWQRAGVNVVTKSGATVETMSTFFAVRQHLIELGGMEFYRSRVVATTDPGSSPLRDVAERDGLRVLDIPAGVGGRFSVTTAVGLFPLAVAGVDIGALLAGARRARTAAFEEDAALNVSASFAAVQLALLESGVSDVVFMPYASGLRDVGCWFVQLWAESLGKIREGVSVGPTPIVAVGATDQHSQLQLFMEGPATKNIVFVELLSDAEEVRIPPAPDGAEALGHLGGQRISYIRRAEMLGVRAALAEVRRPSSTLSLSRLGPESVGELLMALECATALTGWALGVNPFDQPGVELAKCFAHGALGRVSNAEHAERLQSILRSAPPRVSRVS